ncbi:MAG: hypothetical protein ACLVG5_06395 [Clostridium sp.]
MRKMNLKKAMMAAVVAAMALVTVIGARLPHQHPQICQKDNRH